MVSLWEALMAVLASSSGWAAILAAAVATICVILVLVFGVCIVLACVGLGDVRAPIPGLAWAN